MSNYNWMKFHKTLFESNTRMLTIIIKDFKWSKWMEFNWWKNKEDSFALKTCIKIPFNLKTLIFFIKHKVKFKITWKNV